jgi:hypothetical protein
MGITIREMIEKLEEMAKVHGDDKPVCTYDAYLEAEGWDYEQKDLYMKPRVFLDDEMDVLLIR